MRFGKNIIITAHADPQGGDQVPSETNKGVLPSPQDYTIDARRLTGGWEIFDLGVKVDNGVESENSFFADAFLQFNSAGGNLRQDVAEPFLSQKNNALIGDTSMSDSERAKLFTKTFRQIKKDKATHYALQLRKPNGFIQLNSESDKWKDDKTLKLSEEDVSGAYVSLWTADNVFTYPGYIGSHEAHNFNDKLTDVPSYTADEVTEFKLSTAAKIFLCPAFVNFSFGLTAAGHRYEEYAGGGGWTDTDKQGGLSPGFPVTVDQQFYMNHVTYPRLELEEYHEKMRDELWNLRRGGVLYLPWTADTYNTFYNVAKYFRETEGSKMWQHSRGTHFEYDEFGNETRTIIIEREVYPGTMFPSPQIYPAPPGMPKGYVNASTPYEAGARIGGGAVTVSGDLLMMIFQNNKMYYIWSR